MKRLNICKTGSILLKLFLTATAAAVIYYLYDLFSAPFGFSGYRESPVGFFVRLLFIILGLSLLFWTGIITVYLTCKQLGVRKRALGIILGWVPIANLIMLGNIIKTADSEYRFEKNKIKLDRARAGERICATKYPILLVHGVFFRDFEHLNYWGRIPKELEANGAVIFYGSHNSASPVRESAKELEKRILEIVEETGCGKVNIIAHSKGGLDSRYAIAKTSAGKHVASLTTINTPHRGCEFADWMLNKITPERQRKIADAYNACASMLGDTDPDFIAACRDLTRSSCLDMNKQITDDPYVYYQSVGSVQSGTFSGRFPLNMTYLFVKYFDGPNDGLVGERSFKWGEKYTLLSTPGVRGISHGDMIDLNRENIKDFDVREFYVGLVSALRERGL